MKIILSLAFLIITSTANAAKLNGTLDKVSPIKVQTEMGSIKTFTADKLTFVALDGDTIWLDQGYRARCANPPLGKLLEDVVIRIKTTEGSFKTITVEKETAGKKVDIWGDCGDGSNVLEQLVITVRKGTINVK